MAAVDSKQPQQQQQIRAPGIKRLLVIASAVAYVVFLGEFVNSCQAPFCLMLLSIQLAMQPSAVT
jgi:hypothetical protein